METALSRTSLPITMVPFRSLTTTRARGCISTFRLSRSASNSESPLDGNPCRSTRPLSTAVAIGFPTVWLIAAAMSRVIRKSGSRTSSAILTSLLRSIEASRSIRPPLGIRPAVGWFTCLEFVPACPAVYPPRVTAPWASA